MAEHCNFQATLDDMLRDRLVCGVTDGCLQRRLLAEPELTLKGGKHGFFKNIFLHVCIV